MSNSRLSVQPHLPMFTLEKPHTSIARSGGQVPGMPNLPSRGRPQAGFAHLRPPLMSNVRPHKQLRGVDSGGLHCELARSLPSRPSKSIARAGLLRLSHRGVGIRRQRNRVGGWYALVGTGRLHSRSGRYRRRFHRRRYWSSACRTRSHPSRSSARVDLAMLRHVAGHT